MEEPRSARSWALMTARIWSAVPSVGTWPQRRSHKKYELPIASSPTPPATGGCAEGTHHPRFELLRQALHTTYIGKSLVNGVKTMGNRPFPTFALVTGYGDRDLKALRQRTLGSLPKSCKSCSRAD